MEAPRLEGGRINLNAPRFEQSTFLGRAKHFFTITDPRNIFRTARQLDEAKELLVKYRYEERDRKKTQMNKLTILYMANVWQLIIVIIIIIMIITININSN